MQLIYLPSSCLTKLIKSDNVTWLADCSMLFNACSLEHSSLTINTIPFYKDFQETFLTLLVLLSICKTLHKNVILLKVSIQPLAFFIV